MEKIILYTDGGARGNPGPAGIGVSIQDDNGRELGFVSEYIGETTNNQAEYQALYEGLKKAKEICGNLAALSIEVRMDSELVVRQLSGIYKVKDPGMKEQFAKVKEVLDGCSVTFTHVRREHNKRADQLVNDAIDAAGH